MVPGPGGRGADDVEHAPAIPSCLPDDGARRPRPGGPERRLRGGRCAVPGGERRSGGSLLAGGVAGDRRTDRALSRHRDLLAAAGVELPHRRGAGRALVEDPGWAGHGGARPGAELGRERAGNAPVPGRPPVDEREPRLDGTARLGGRQSAVRRTGRHPGLPESHGGGREPRVERVPEGRERTGPGRPGPDRDRHRADEPGNRLRPDVRPHLRHAALLRVRAALRLGLGIRGGRARRVGLPRPLLG